MSKVKGHSMTMCAEKQVGAYGAQCCIEI